MANSFAAFNRTTWSQRIIQNLDQVNVMRNLVNTDWEGDLENSRTVRVRTYGNVVMQDYVKYTGPTAQDLAPGFEDFPVNGFRAFRIDVDDVDRVQTDLPILDGYTRRAAVAMSNDVEAKILSPVVAAVPGLNQVTGTNAGTGAVPGTVTISGGAVTAIALGTAGSGYDTAPVVSISWGPSGGGGFGARAHATISGGAVTGYVIDNGGECYTTAPTVTVAGGDTITLDSSTTQTGTTRGIFPVITQMAEALSAQNVPEMGRYLVVDPKIRTLLWNDKDHFVRATDLGDAIVLSGKFDADGRGTKANAAPGFIGQIAGFDTYMVTHLPTGSGCRYMVAGTRDFITYAGQLVEIEAMRSQSYFGNFVRGLLVHDATVFNQNCYYGATAKVA